MIVKPIVIQSQALTDAGGIEGVSDTTWATNKSVIKHIWLETASTNWSLRLYFNAVGNAGYIPEGLALVTNGNGDIHLSLDIPYSNYDAGSTVYFQFTDNTGSNNAVITVIGEKTWDNGQFASLLPGGDDSVGIDPYNALLDSLTENVEEIPIG